MAFLVELVVADKNLDPEISKRLEDITGKSTGFSSQEGREATEAGYDLTKPDDRSRFLNIKKGATYTVVATPAEEQREQQRDRLDEASKRQQPPTSSLGAIDLGKTISAADLPEHRQGAQKPVKPKTIGYLRDLGEATS